MERNRPAPTPEELEMEARLAVAERAQADRDRIASAKSAAREAWRRERLDKIRTGLPDPGPFPDIEQAMEEEDSTAARTIGMALGCHRDADGPNYEADAPQEPEEAPQGQDDALSLVPPACAVCGEPGDRIHWAREVSGALDHAYASEVPASEMLDVAAFQREVHAWCVRNFGVQTDLVLYGGTAEEVGEVLRGAVKREQGIRGTTKEWDAIIKQEIGDVVVKLASICGKEGWSLRECILDRWAEVGQRNWVTNKTGHGLPEA